MTTDTKFILDDGADEPLGLQEKPQSLDFASALLASEIEKLRINLSFVEKAMEEEGLNEMQIRQMQTALQVGHSYIKTTPQYQEAGSALMLLSIFEATNAKLFKSVGGIVETKH